MDDGDEGVVNVRREADVLARLLAPRVVVDSQHPRMLRQVVMELGWDSNRLLQALNHEPQYLQRDLVGSLVILVNGGSVSTIRRKRKEKPHPYQFHKLDAPRMDNSFPLCTHL